MSHLRCVPSERSSTIHIPHPGQGGYNLDSISRSALSVCNTILGEAPPELPPLVASEAAAETIWHVAIEQSKYWKNIDPKGCEPQEGTNALSSCLAEINPIIHTDVEEETFSIPGKEYPPCRCACHDSCHLFQSSSRRIARSSCIANLVCWRSLYSTTTIRSYMLLKSCARKLHVRAFTAALVDFLF